jgi:hypothetical protein
MPGRLVKSSVCSAIFILARGFIRGKPFQGSRRSFTGSLAAKSFDLTARALKSYAQFFTMRHAIAIKEKLWNPFF